MPGTSLTLPKRLDFIGLQPDARRVVAVARALVLGEIGGHDVHFA